MVRYKGIKTLEVLEGADNYNAWIAGMLSPYIESPALEVGAGTGNISEFFGKLESLVITDNDPELVKFLEDKFSLKKNVHAEVLDIASKFGDVKVKFRTVYAINVLEHIENDKLALQNVNKLLVPGGRIVLLVPAKKFAYTKLDKSLGHFRRYEKEELRKKLTDANFTIKKIEYFNIVGLASWIIRNIISVNHSDLKKSHVKFFDSIVPILRKIEPRSGLPFGISLIAVASKN
jgi:SAM-dependent methyltransferase